MDQETAAILDFVQSNRKEMAAYIRKKLLAANAQAYLDGLGKDGVEALDREAAGVLVDLAGALARRLNPQRPRSSEEILNAFPEAVRTSIHLPRSDEYYKVLNQLPKLGP